MLHNMVCTCVKLGSQLYSYFNFSYGEFLKDRYGKYVKLGTKDYISLQMYLRDYFVEFYRPDLAKLMRKLNCIIHLGLFKNSTYTATYTSGLYVFKEVVSADVLICDLENGYFVVPDTNEEHMKDPMSFVSNMLSMTFKKTSECILDKTIVQDIKNTIDNFHDGVIEVNIDGLTEEFHIIKHEDMIELHRVDNPSIFITENSDIVCYKAAPLLYLLSIADNLSSE